MPENGQQRTSKQSTSGIVEYEQGAPFAGVLGRTLAESSPAWPAPARAPEGAPNVLFWVLDDVGFGQTTAFGGLVETPNLDRLAENGLRYTNMHTAALCSPSRSCILTGRNHHSNHISCITEAATGYPGADGRMPFENGMISEILKPHGYNTFITGKWHVAPSEDSSPAGPYNRWPIGRGFERFYGWLGCESSSWYPELYYDNHPVEAEKSPEEGYHLDEDTADHAIRFILDAHINAPEKPFLLYHACAAGKSPHHAPREWIEKYDGKFDMGWDEYRRIVFERQKELGIVSPDADLPAHDPDVPEWSSLTDDQKRLCTRMMQVYAGFVSHADDQFGRILDTLEQIGELDNTLIVVISDNGASSEGGLQGKFNEAAFLNFVEEKDVDILPRIDELGGPTSYGHYAWGWAMAGNTPFRRWKREVFRGGCTDPFVLHWPARVKSPGELRTQYAHIIDMVPTVLDLLGIEPPEAIAGVKQAPIEGVSFAHTVDDAGAATHHRTQYFEMLGNRAIDHDGWRAVCGWPGPSFTEGAKKGRRLGDEITPELLEALETEWQLFNIAVDPAESHDLAAEHPEKLRELIDLWWAEAEKYQVLPLDGTMQQRVATERPRASKSREQYVYYPALSVVPTFNTPPVYNRPHSITAELHVPEGGAEGVILAQAGVTGGYSLYVKDGRLRYVHNYVARELYEVVSEEELPTGEITVRFEFEVTTPPKIREGLGAGGLGQLYFDGKLVANTEIPVTTPIMFGFEGLSCGYDAGAAVTPAYKPPFEFTGTIHRVTVDVSGDLIEDDDHLEAHHEAHAAAIMATV
jgi:arylsulfatase A-like enzyme